MRRALSLLGLALGTTLPVSGCGLTAERPAVPMHIAGVPRAVADASVVIDEQYIGPLGYVVARGVLLPVGKHRITVEKAGYFPWDKIVDADRQPIELRVQLVPIPD